MGDNILDVSNSGEVQTNLMHTALFSPAEKNLEALDKKFNYLR